MARRPTESETEAVVELASPPLELVATEDVDTPLDYDGVNAAIGETTAKLTGLLNRKRELEEAYARGAHYEEASKTPIMSDEGVSVARLSGHRIINLTDPKADLMNARKLTLHVNGVVYQHVEDAPNGQWMYRSDK